MIKQASTDMVRPSTPVELKQDSKSTQYRYWVALTLCLTALAAFLIDIPLARYVQDVKLPGDVVSIVRISEFFAHGSGVVMILVTIAVLAPSLRRQLLRLVACAGGAGLVAQLIKLTVARHRPSHFKGSNFPESAWSTFQGWAPWLTSGGPVQHHLQSFPSGHTATAVGLAVGLSFLLPRGRWLFAFFAALAAMQRIQSQNHYLSDTLAAGALGCLIAGLCTDRRALGKWFDRWELRGVTR